MSQNEFGVITREFWSPLTSFILKVTNNTTITFQKRKIYNEKKILKVFPPEKIDLSSPNKLLMYGYGSYEWSCPPTFSTSRLSLLDRGFIYALAHPRGFDFCLLLFLNLNLMVSSPC